MELLGTFLSSLRDRVFKLLPMREDYDKGCDNHLFDYVNNLKIGIDGGFICYPDLRTDSMMVEVRNNIGFLMSDAEIPFKQWRNIVLRSTRLLSTLLTNYAKRGDDNAN